MNNGNYKQIVKGNNGDVEVEISVSDSQITDINVVNHNETEGIGNTAFDTLIPKIIENQSLNVDVVSGATVTSNALLTAVEQAVTEAGGDLEAFNKTEDQVSKELESVEMDTDFVIVGGGSAGLSAAITAADAGHQTTLVETLPYLGGNTIISAGIIQAAGTSVQEEHGIKNDSPEKFIDDLALDNPKYNSEDKPLSHIMHEGSAQKVEELKVAGLEFAPFEEETPRYHVIAPEMFKGGQTLISFLKEKAEDLGVEILVNTRVNELIIEEDVVKGVKAKSDSKDLTINAKSTILTTGGYSSNSELVAELLPDYAELNSRAGKGAQGDGIALAESAGGYKYAIDSGQQMFYVNPDTGTDVPLLLLFTPSIIVNENGERFVNESIDYNLAARACVSQPNAIGYIIFDEASRKSHSPIENYINQGMVVEADTVEELAEKLDIPALKTTVEHYNDMVENGKDEDFGREVNFEAIDESKFYGIKVEPRIYNSYGGIKIDEKGHVLKEDGDYVKGLYAGGEIAGSPEVQEGLSYTTGIGQALVFGEIATETAIEEL